MSKRSYKMSRFPLITAHSGCMDTVPNSIESIFEGIRAGADIVEVDIRATKDGVAVLMHDEGINLSKYGIVGINELSFDELKKEYAEIVRLDEIFGIIRSFNIVVNLDLKDDTAVEPMVKTVNKGNIKDYIILSGCEYHRAMYINENYKGFYVLLNSDDKIEISEQDIESNNKYDTFIAETCRNAIMANCRGINQDYRMCLKEMVDYAALRCLPICVYTIDDVNDMEKYINLGVHSITTNRVDLLSNLKKQL